MTWQTGGTIVAVLAVLYGLGIAFGLRSASEKTRSGIIVGGALLLLVLAILLVLLPYLGVY